MVALRRRLLHSSRVCRRVQASVERLGHGARGGRHTLLANSRITLSILGGQLGFLQADSICVEVVQVVEVARTLWF